MSGIIEIDGQSFQAGQQVKMKSTGWLGTVVGLVLGGQYLSVDVTIPPDTPNMIPGVENFWLTGDEVESAEDL